MSGKGDDMQKVINIHAGHRERMKKRFAVHGLDNLTTLTFWNCCYFMPARAAILTLLHTIYWSVSAVCTRFSRPVYPNSAA